jgi:hypothetical protein
MATDLGKMAWFKKMRLNGTDTPLSRPLLFHTLSRKAILSLLLIVVLWVAETALI